MSYSDSHRHFNQSLLTHKVLKRRDAEQLAKQIQELYDGEVASFPEFVQIINSRLEQFGFKIASGFLEQNGSEWVGLVNTVNDAAAKKATKMSQANLEYFRICLQHIAAEESGSVSSSILLGLVDKLERKMTKKAAQDFLKSQVVDHWFCEKRGYYSMGPRCILELLPFLPDIIGLPVDECHLCSVHVVMGQRCSNCDTKLHLYCLDKLAKNRGGQIKCPQCHTDWEHDIPDLQL